VAAASNGTFPAPPSCTQGWPKHASEFILCLFIGLFDSAFQFHVNFVFGKLWREGSLLWN
jgi:hypothetical protein